MKMNKRLNVLLNIIAAFIMASMAMSSVALAADPAPESTTTATCMRDLIMSKASEYIDNGSEYKDAVAAAHIDVINQLFNEGKITEEQKDRMLSCQGMMGGRGMMGGMACPRMNQ